MIYLCQAMGIPIDTVAVAELKDEGRRFMDHHFPGIKHQFLCCNHLSDVVKECQKCDGKCTFDREESADLATAGLPCQPFSILTVFAELAKKNGARGHKLFGAVAEFLYYLKVRRPKGFIIEEILRLLGIDPVTGQRWVDWIVSEAGKLNYGTAAAKVVTDAWAKTPRDRLVICFLGMCLQCSM